MPTSWLSSGAIMSEPSRGKTAEQLAQKLQAVEDELTRTSMAITPMSRSNAQAWLPMRKPRRSTLLPLRRARLKK